jgi:hypothetical protein
METKIENKEKTCLEKHETLIPFYGFYEAYDSLATNVIEMEVEHLAEENNLDETAKDNLYQILENNLDESDYRKQVCQMYVIEYMNILQNELDEKFNSLVFVGLDSPKEYNFRSDRIFCSLDTYDLIKFHKIIMKDYAEDFKEMIKKRFTSYDGFYSFYPNDLEKWSANVWEWDYNQIGTMFELFNYNDVLYDYFHEIISDCIWQNDKPIEEILNKS